MPAGLREVDLLMVRFTVIIGIEGSHTLCFFLVTVLLSSGGADWSLYGVVVPRLL